MKIGDLCRISGMNYEKRVYNILQKCRIDGKRFNTQTIDELGGSKSHNDIECNYLQKKIGIEIKSANSPSWMQCSLKYKTSWKASERGKIPFECQNLFNDLIKDLEIPEKKKWKDKYIDIPNDTIKKLYSFKGCYYIQISHGYGLYHLGNDICNFNVPEFIIPQQIRIRLKPYKNNNWSVMAACQPKNIKLLKKSPYSLDKVKKLPENLFFLST